VFYDGSVIISSSMSAKGDRTMASDKVVQLSDDTFES
jgi:hypothetical protein